MRLFWYEKYLVQKYLDVNIHKLTKQYNTKQHTRHLNDVKFNGNTTIYTEVFQWPVKKSEVVISKQYMFFLERDPCPILIIIPYTTKPQYAHT